ncbi:hypothetical protein ENHYDAX1_220295 [Enhydrobacter sp. AX1]|nr:hypothetical protein ENHYDAX1_220295 [Enhydrobacter sp. AX1]
MVRHRIDGLETPFFDLRETTGVRHRIDGLENLQLEFELR